MDQYTKNATQPQNFHYNPTTIYFTKHVLAGCRSSTDQIKLYRTTSKTRNSKSSCYQPRVRILLWFSDTSLHFSEDSELPECMFRASQYRIER